jgi:hypothetical protein
MHRRGVGNGRWTAARGPGGVGVGGGEAGRGAEVGAQNLRRLPLPGLLMARGGGAEEGILSFLTCTVDNP